MTYSKTNDHGGGRIIHLQSSQWSGSVDPLAIMVMSLVAIVTTISLSGRLPILLAWAPLAGLILQLLFHHSFLKPGQGGKNDQGNEDSIQFVTKLINIALDRARSRMGKYGSGLAILCGDATLAVTYMTSSISSTEAYGLMPMAGVLCILLFNLLALKSSPSRLALTAGVTSLVLLVQLCIGQSLFISLVVTSLFVLVWIALACRRPPVLEKYRIVKKTRYSGFRYGAKTALYTMGVSLPLMVVLFFLFPRIPLDFVQSNRAERTGIGRTGLSDSLTLGSITQLQKSQQPAFSASFKGKAPTDTSLYWRAMVLDRLDGNTWLSSNKPAANDSISKGDRKFSASENEKSIAYISVLDSGNNNPHPVVLDGTYGRLFVAYNNLSATITPSRDGSYSIPSAGTKGSERSPENGEGSVKIYSLAGNFDPDYKLGLPLVPKNEGADLAASTDSGEVASEEGAPRNDMSDWTRLPPDFNPETQDFGRRLRKQLGTEKKVVEFVLKMINVEDYHYTLRPPKLGSQAIDDFFLRTKYGFCEHYASAFVVAMRGAGIPARLISGYLSGGVVDGLVNVNQSDAHAWAEIWIEGRGWVRQDPTASISPSRVDPDAANSLLESRPEGFFGYLGLNWSKFGGKAEKSWRENMSGFDADRQASVFRKMGIEGTSKPIIFVFAMVLVLAASLLIKYFSRLIDLNWKKRTGNHLSDLLEKRCAGAGLERSPGQTCRDLGKRAEDTLGTAQATELRSIIDQYDWVVYSERADTQASRELASRIRAFKPVPEQSSQSSQSSQILC